MRMAQPLIFIVLALKAWGAQGDQGPCDILAGAGNTCFAAHSTVRALYSSYAGPLYNVRRPNNESVNISVLEAGGFADIAAHEKFCPAGECVIATVFDQSPQGNHLGQRNTTDGSGNRVVHKMVNASAHKIAVRGGVSVFGMWFGPGYGYNRDFTVGVPKGNEPESIYAVMSGTHFNDKCCFDYGNSENTITADGDYGSGAMEAIYFGNAHWKGNTGFDSGPWVGADLEAGMYYGGGNATIVNNASQPLKSDFVSLHLKGRTDGFALRGGDATRGPLVTMYDGPRPDPTLACCVDKEHYYQPMRKKAAIILGTGGDNSNGAEGSFYEGIMATGVTSAATDDAIQANIIAVGYRTSVASTVV